MAITEAPAVMSDRELAKLERAAEKAVRATQRAIEKQTRELANAEKEVRKIQAQRARANRERQKLAQIETKRRAARRYLPDEYPDWERSEKSDTLLLPAGFMRVSDRHLFEQVKDSLQSATFDKAFSSLAAIFGCEKSEIFLIESGVVTRKKTMIPVLYFRYTYNVAFNDVLKKTNRASFNKNTKSWYFDFSEEAVVAVSQDIGSFYRVVIDLNSMVIVKSDAAPSMSVQARVAFGKLPFHIKVDKGEVISAILRYRPTELIKEDKFYINDGSGFVVYPEQDAIWTQSPFLLFRYSVAGGEPRYVSFSTLGMVVERISFGNCGKITSSIIARYMDSCATLKLSAFECDESKIIADESCLKTQLHGDFDRFSNSIRVIKSAIPDIGFAPLCSDYATLVSSRYGADSESAGIIAYVVPNYGENHYLSKIAEFFGYAKSDYPVVFTRSILNEWNEQEDYNFLFIAAHELAHWLIFEKGLEVPDDAHGIAWAICQDLLEYVFTDEYSITAHSIYSKYKSQEIASGIVYVVNEVGIPAIDDVRSLRAISKSDIQKITYDCLQKFASLFSGMSAPSGLGRSVT